MKTNIITKNPFNQISITVFILIAGALTGVYLLQLIPVSVFVGLLVFSVFATSSIQIADQWEKAVVLRMGKYKGLK